MYHKNWHNLIFVGDWIFFSVNVRSLNNGLKFVECFQVLLVLKTALPHLEFGIPL